MALGGATRSFPRRLQDLPRQFDAMPTDAAYIFTVTDEPLVVRVKTLEEGVPLDQERVTAADMSGPVSELWLEGFLRQGHPDVPLEQVQPQLLPKLAESGGTRCSGFDLEVVNPSGQRTRRTYSLLCLLSVARRAVARLRQAGRLAAGARAAYELLLQPGKGLAAPHAAEGVGEIVVQRPALSYLRISLGDLRARARTVQAAAPGLFPVFYTERALSRAEACSRAGASHAPPVETGGVLAGSLCASPCGEFFCVVTDVLAAKDAEQTSYSLGFSDRTWTRFQRVLQTRQSQHPELACRLLGSCHGHNFLPNLAPTASDPNACPSCPKQATCSLTSAFASEDDQIWSQAVFAQQPWQLMHVFGLTPRSERVHALFGVQEGRLQERSFHVLPEFDAAVWLDRNPA